jgi:hypothetical protein
VPLDREFINEEVYTMKRYFVSSATWLAPLFLFTASVSAEQLGSGFLDDYSKLRENSQFKDDGVKIHVEKGFDLGKYDKLLIVYPKVYLDTEGDSREINPKELIELTDYLHEKLIGAVEDDYALADEAGPGVLVIRSAITDVVPIKAAAGATVKVVLKVVNVDLGGASIEAEFIDGGTGKQMVALMDTEKGKRFGMGSAGGKTWGHTKVAFKDWAKRMASFLGDRRYGQVQKKK